MTAQSNWTYPHIRRHPDGRRWQVVGPGDVELCAGDLATCQRRVAEMRGPQTRKSDEALRRAIGA